jgi:hypothetical protein
MDFDQHQPAAALAARIDRAVDRLDQRAFAHAASAPQQGIVGRQPAGETAGVLDQGVAGRLDALEKVERQPGDFANGMQFSGSGLPDEGVGQAVRLGRGVPVAGLVSWVSSLPSPLSRPVVFGPPGGGPFGRFYRQFGR